MRVRATDGTWPLLRPGLACAVLLAPTRVARTGTDRGALACRPPVGGPGGCFVRAVAASKTGAPARVEGWSFERAAWLVCFLLPLIAACLANCARPGSEAAGRTADGAVAVVLASPVLVRFGATLRRAFVRRRPETAE